MKQQQSVFICQLMHAGALSQVLSHTMAPSAIKPLGKQSRSSGGSGDFPIPAAMTIKNIKQAIKGYQQAARNAVVAGFDGIEVHAANGYLPDQFITEYTNSRTDHYGVTVENRFRFTAEIIAEIKAVVPPGFIVGLRLSESKINNLAYRWNEGHEMAIQLFGQVKKATPDYLHLAAEGGDWKRECLYTDGRSSSGIAKQLLACPVIANGGLHDLELAKEIITTNQGDFLAIGRYAIANPDFPNRIRNNDSKRPFDSKMIQPSLTLENTTNFFLQSSQRASSQFS